MKRFCNVKALVLLCVLCIVGYICYDFFFKESLEEPSLDQLPRHERLALKKNIMVMGIDERPADGDPGRSDTLFVVMFDQNKKSIALLSIPRDTRVRIPGHGWDKINHAYAFGGRELSQKTVEQFLGIRIDNYVTVDFNGFKGLVDVIGGVDIDVEKDMYYYDSWDGFKIDLKKGRQRLDGATAIQYVRYRDEDGDIGRIKRQQHFLLAVYSRITSADMLLKIPGLGRQLSSMIKTDMPVGDMVDVGRALHSMVQENKLAMATVPGTPQYIDEISYWIPDVTALRAEMAEMQGAQMSERYKNAAQLLAQEYDRSVAAALHDDARSSEGAADETQGAFLTAEGKAVHKRSAAKRDNRAQGKNAASEAKPGKPGKRSAIRQESARDNAQQAAGQQAAVTPAQPAAPARPAAPAPRAAVVTPDRSKTVVRLVNCSGSAQAADEAAERLQRAGFTVIRSGNDREEAATLVVSTTNNGAIVARLANIPFAHQMRIVRNASADCDAVIMLGRDFH